MTGKLRSILSRHRANPAQPCLINDFTLGPITTANASILDQEEWSLYCLDFAADSAVFVHVAGGLELDNVPFVYQAQFEQADQVFVLPLPDFLRIGLAMPAPERVTFLYSTGRCGSTLASRILSQLPGVVSLSEPEGIISPAHQADAIGNRVHWRYIRAALHFLCRGQPGERTPHYVIKPRPVSLLYDAEFTRACPNAHIAFLYRGCGDYVRSMFRFGQRLGLDWDTPGPIEKWWPHWQQMSGGAPRTVLGEFVTLDRKDITWAEIGAALWAVTMRAFHGINDRGRSATAIHYDDLNRDRLAGTAKLIQACGLDIKNANAGLRAFEIDAHTGGRGANTIPSREMDATQTRRMDVVMSRMGMPNYAQARL